VTGRICQLQFDATKAATLINGHGHALESPTGCIGSGQTMSLYSNCK